MNRFQRIALVVAVINMVVITLFPPVDQYSVAASSIPVFAGFYFITGLPPMAVINSNLLVIEFVVILVNLAIAWLLLADRTTGGSRQLNLQNAALFFTGTNLVLMLLFPPMEYVFAVSKSTIPTFEGFYFIFAQKPAHVIVQSLLWLEITFIVINGALLWLMFRERKPPSAAELRDAMRDFSSSK